MITGVLLDLEDTLVVRESYAKEVDLVIYYAVAERLSCRLQEAMAVVKYAQAKFHTTTMALESFGISRHTLYERLDSLELKRPPTAVQGASAALQLLATRGLKLGVITNMPRLLATKILRAANVQVSILDVLVTGSDTTCPKPAKEPFLTALSLLGIRAGECMMVGDREDVDLCPAKELGMVTVLLNSQPTLAQFRVSGLLEVVDLVDALNGNPCLRYHDK